MSSQAASPSPSMEAKNRGPRKPDPFGRDLDEFFYNAFRDAAVERIERGHSEPPEHIPEPLGPGTGINIKDWAFPSGWDRVNPPPKTPPKPLPQKKRQRQQKDKR